jgi:hypothetical protein
MRSYPGFVVPAGVLGVIWISPCGIGFSGGFAVGLGKVVEKAESEV